MVVLVTDFPTSAGQSLLSLEEEEKEVDEKDRALSEALRVVVSGWLQEEGNDLNYNNTVSSSKDQLPIHNILNKS